LSNRVEVGYVARAHGLRGEVRVHLHAPESTILLEVEEAWIGGAPRKIVAARPTPGAVLLVLEGVADRDAADALRGEVVEVAREAIPLAEGEFLLADLPGCAVVDVAGRALGDVVEVLSGAQPILVIHGGGHELLVPVVPEMVHSVDTAARRVVVDLPEDMPVEKIR
jgi:16S rRNA processing protein RimM